MKVRLVAVFAALMLMFGVACSTNRANTPDVKNQVQDSLKANNLGDVKVDQDRDKGVVTLSGEVKTQEEKTHAEEVAKENAPGMVVSNEIAVRPEGAEHDARKIDRNLDEGIEDNFKAALTANNLDSQHIRYDAKEGVLTLKGDVDTPQQRELAETTGAKVPNVKQVVNELTVKHSAKATTRRK